MISRPSLPATAADIARQPHVGWFPLIEMVFDSGVVRIAGAAFDVEYNGSTWVSGRGLVSMSPIGESADEIMGLQFTVSGVPTAALAEAQQEKYQGRPCTVLMAFLASEDAAAPTLDVSFVAPATNGAPTLATDLTGQQYRLGSAEPGAYWLGAWTDPQVLHVDPLAWQGFLDMPTINRAQGTCTVSVTAEHRLADWNRPRKFLFNHADQQRIDPGDNFYLGIEAMAERTIVVFSKEVMAV